MRSLEEAYDDALLNVAYHTHHIATDPRLTNIGAHCLELEQYYRFMARCELLIDGNVDAFAHGLIDAAQMRRYLLQRAHDEALFGLPQLRTSLNKGFLDALVANEWRLAHRIASLALTEPLLDWEYEDDFLYFHFLQGFILQNLQGSEGLKAALTRYETVLEGQEDERLAVVWAFQNHDAAAFTQAFYALQDRYHAQCEADREAAYDFTEDRMIWLEGLALLRIADQLRWPTEREYAYCPSWVRQVQFAPYAPRVFPNLPLNV